VATYYAYTVTTYASFTTAIWILFVRSQGLSFAAVGALNSVWWAGIVFGEIPTGYLGDRLGRRNSMLLGTGIITAMTVAMAHSTTFGQFAVVYGLWALGHTSRSGSDDAWLYEVLRERESGGDFARVKGRATGIGLAVGVPESATKTAVGVVYAGFTAVAAVVSYFTGAIEARLGIRGWFVLAPVVVGGLFLALWVLPVLAVPAFFVARAANTATVTLGNQYLNDRIDSVGRATVLSSASMALSLAVIPFELVGGVFADLLSPVRALTLFGGVLVVGVGVLWLAAEPVGVGSSTGR
jgi:MFS family permease